MTTARSVHPDPGLSPTGDELSSGVNERSVTKGRGTPAWLGPFFALAGAWPSVARMLRPIACAVVPLVSAGVREATRRNARWIFGRDLCGAERRRFTRRVVGSFYDFVLDVGRSSRMSPGELAGLVEAVEGLEEYRAARAARRGAILVTAHLGTFEVGLAALAGEERRIRVVFKRDAAGAFERMRARLHDALGVVEAPIDDGMGTWLALREALQRDEVVVMQGDRAMPGQKSEVVPFLHGHLRLPTGPVRLARLTGSPIIPVFALATGKGGYKVVLKAPIEADGENATSAAGDPRAPSAMEKLASAMAEVVAEHPHQWLALEPVFHEDGADGYR
ncbi:MAG: lysophospholipid acyltransferase family protein [Planctomycetota bacterium]